MMMLAVVVLLLLLMLMRVVAAVGGGGEAQPQRIHLHVCELKRGGGGLVVQLQHPPTTAVGIERHERVQLLLMMVVVLLMVGAETAPAAAQPQGVHVGQDELSGVLLLLLARPHLLQRLQVEVLDVEVVARRHNDAGGDEAVRGVLAPLAVHQVQSAAGRPPFWFVSVVIYSKYSLPLSFCLSLTPGLVGNQRAGLTRQFLKIR